MTTVVTTRDALLDTQQAFDGVASGYDQSNEANPVIRWMRAETMRAVRAASWSELWKVALASAVEKANVALALLLGLGGVEVSVVSGGVVSIVKLRLSGVGSGLPAGSTARTWTVCGPSGSVGVV